MVPTAIGSPVCKRIGLPCRLPISPAINVRRPLVCRSAGRMRPLALPRLLPDFVQKKGWWHTIQNGRIKKKKKKKKKRKRKKKTRRTKNSTQKKKKKQIERVEKNYEQVDLTHPMMMRERPAAMPSLMCCLSHRRKITHPCTDGRPCSLSGCPWLDV